MDPYLFSNFVDPFSEFGSGSTRLKLLAIIIHNFLCVLLSLCIFLIFFFSKLITFLREKARILILIQSGANFRIQIQIQNVFGFTTQQNLSRFKQTDKQMPMLTVLYITGLSFVSFKTALLVGARSTCQTWTR